MSVRIGHASQSETGGKNGTKGDSTKKEVCIREWYDKGWDFVAIHPDASVREKHAQAVEDACNNDYIGYGQNDRNTAHTQYLIYKAIKAIKTKCNTDCSALQNLAALVSGANGVTYGSNGWTTSTMRKALKDAGYIIIAEKTILASAKYCVRGGIYVKEGIHTVCGLDNGEKYADTLKYVKTGATTSNSEKVANSKSSTSTSSGIDAAKSYDKSIAGKYTTTATLLNMRAGAGKDKTSLCKIPLGSKVHCYGYYTTVSGVKWYLVAHNEKNGYCSSEFLKKA
jgi:hypothetical protein